MRDTTRLFESKAVGQAAKRLQWRVSTVRDRFEGLLWHRSSAAL